MPKVVWSPLPICEDNMEQNLPTNVNPDVCKREESKQPKIRDYELESARLESFNNWPYLTPQKLAAAGFYYTGNGDRTICYECGLDLENWEVGDDPWECHAEFSRYCPYLHRIKGVAVADLIEKIWRRRLSSTEEQEIVESSTNGTLGEQTEGTGNTCIASGSSESAPSSESIAIESTETAEGIQKRKLSVKSSTLGGEGFCKYCHVRKTEMVFAPCSHMISCNKCAPNVSKCVKCDKPVKHFLPPISLQ